MSRRAARVLDVGCGDGALMAALRDSAAATRAGSNSTPATSPARWRAGCRWCRATPIPTWPIIPTPAFDYAILSQTLQTTHAPDVVLDQLLRIGARAFVSFPNFAHWRVRASLLWGGRMPVTRLLPLAWYETPNIHHVTIDDFRAYVQARGIVGGGRVVPQPRAARPAPRRRTSAPSMRCFCCGD